jgi:hypothetical protein
VRGVVSLAAPSKRPCKQASPQPASPATCPPAHLALLARLLPTVQVKRYLGGRLKGRS